MTLYLCIQVCQIWITFSDTLFLNKKKYLLIEPLLNDFCMRCLCMHSIFALHNTNSFFANSSTYILEFILPNVVSRSITYLCHKISLTIEIWLYMFRHRGLHYVYMTSSLVRDPSALWFPTCPY
jgi:hypothetical protein